ncbi:uridine diphosphate glucose pyrophosphatase NUDT14 isoform X4 [Grus americana]|uniref:uridine diphosphate glucose pyrophosphatase NUDT14 isoform X4 n=1 Tax=Grus americana TaxID=9117 RepID=UPI0024085A2C|nr:uridine diphosphate glucose pyrophosphatase NUDT14 isoform X4 [Grus americana]
MHRGRAAPCPARLGPARRPQPGHQRLRAPLPFLLPLFLHLLAAAAPGRDGGHRGAGGQTLHLFPLPAAFPPLLPAGGHPHFSQVDATKGQQTMNGTKKFWDFMRTHDRSGVGVTGSRQTLFYAEVTDQMRTGEGGGQPEEGELIEVVEVPLEDAMKFAYDETLPKTMGVIFSFMWFQNNIAPKLPKK